MESVDKSSAARARLSVISSHLFAYDSSSHSILEASTVSAVPPPPKVKGTLTILDERTGKKYSVQVSDHGTIKATDLKKVSTVYETFFFFIMYDF